MSQISMASVKPEEGKFVAPHAPRPVWGDKIRKELSEIVGGEVYMWDNGLLDSLEQCIGYIYELLEHHSSRLLEEIYSRATRITTAAYMINGSRPPFVYNKQNQEKQ